MKIATYNINGVNGHLHGLLDWLAESQPDLVCLQEIRTSDPKFPADALARAGYGAIWHGQPSHHGVAVLARGTVPKERRRGLPGDPHDLQARYVEAEVGDVVVGSVYLPNGNPAPGPRFDYKLSWFDRFLAHSQTLLAAQRPVILAGDLNVVPTDFDIYSPWTWRFDAVMQPESRAAFQKLLAQGWVDAIRQQHPSSGMYSFWTSARAFERGQGFRLDFLLLNPVAAGALASSGVDASCRGRDRPSDHAPVWLVLDERVALAA